MVWCVCVCVCCACVVMSKMSLCRRVVSQVVYVHVCGRSPTDSIVSEKEDKSGRYLYLGYDEHC